MAFGMFGAPMGLFGAAQGAGSIFGGLNPFIASALARATTGMPGKKKKKGTLLAPATMMQSPIARQMSGGNY